MADLSVSGESWLFPCLGLAWLAVNFSVQFTDQYVGSRGLKMKLVVEKNGDALVWRMVNKGFMCASQQKPPVTY